MTEYLKPSPYSSDVGDLIGKLPSELTRSELEALGHPTSFPRAIRAKCMDCVYSSSEVAKCIHHSCPLWPFRMGRNPFHARSRVAMEEGKEPT